MPDTSSALFQKTRTHQNHAADPAVSAWVRANAGAGKTYVLARRVLRLLLSGVPVPRILCLTYTKAAAAEMAKRVLGELGAWCLVPDTALRASLADLLGRDPHPEELRLARTLFARVLETPGGLRAETIHAFSERLLRRCPAEAGVPPGYVILDDGETQALKREAIGAVLADAARERDGRLGRALARAIPYAIDADFDALVCEAMAARSWIEGAQRLASGDGADPWAPVRAVYRTLLGIRPDASLDGLDAALASAVSEDDLRRVAAAGAGGPARDRESAERAAAALAAGAPFERIAALEAFFCTGKGEPRKSLLTSAIAAAHGDLPARLAKAQEAFTALLDERLALEAAEATVALLELAEAATARYAAAKARRSGLDFDDLIVLADRLLARAPGFADWALYKLDGGLDHILVDEAQDMSARQWTIVEALARRFLSGNGNGTPPVRNDTAASPAQGTLFAVGDEKQSIYSFQGAAPEMFAAQGRRFAELAGGAGLAWRTLPLTLSFRTVSPILAAVDEVFKDPLRTPGLTAGDEAVRHAARRAGQGGLVELWPAECWDETEAADPWAPLDETIPSAPAARLVARIADTIRHWLDTGERLVSQDRPLRAGDILILVRKRQPFAGPMVAALKARGIPVAGADRIRLLSEIAVLDLMALGDALLLPADDLVLASVLKSPLFGFGDDDLFALAHNRKETLWAALFARKNEKPLYGEAAGLLARWRARMASSPPFEFYTSLLDGDGMRARLLARLGQEAADPIGEFLNLALAYGSRAAPSLFNFLAYVRGSAREIKRDMEEGGNAVRVMTVHGAKGLEAPVVFLPDTCGAPGSGSPPPLLHLPGAVTPSAFPDPLLWAIKGSGRLGPVREVRETIRTRETHEYHRLLYVAMTRARDRLYVAGFEGKRGRPKGCWYDLVADALKPLLVPVTLPDGTVVRRMESPQTAPPEPSREQGIADAAPVPPLPEWAARPARREVRPVFAPFAPSRAFSGTREDASGSADEDGEAFSRPPLPGRRPGTRLPPPVPADTVRSRRLLQGTLTHALLEHLPALPPVQRKAAADAYVARQGAGLGVRARRTIVAEVLAVLDNPVFAPVFGPESRAEVPVVARIPRPAGRKGPPLEISGQIDRLALADGAVRIADYKTNRPFPDSAAAIPEAYLVQLAAYRLALREIFPGRSFQAAILWTAGPRLMEVPAELLARAEERLWDLDAARAEPGET